MKNSRLTKPAERDYVAYGVPFRVQAERRMLERLVACLPYGTEAGDGSGALFAVDGDSGKGFSVAVEGVVALHSAQLEPVLERLTTELMVHVANYAPDRVFVHAGVVGWQGRALVLPGTSFAGKTTLVAALVRAGATYYSDEYAVVDAAGRVHPHARDLRMRQPGEREQKDVAVAELGGSAGLQPLPVAQVVFAEYAAGGVWRPQTVSAGLAVLEMLRHSIPVQRTPARVMATLAAMMESATAWKSERGDAAETARMLLASMSV